MTRFTKTEWAIIAGQALMLALLIPFALWLGTKLPAEEQPISALTYHLAGAAR
jgi:hypothetical protein